VWHRLTWTLKHQVLCYQFRRNRLRKEWEDMEVLVLREPVFREGLEELFQKEDGGGVTGLEL